MAAPIGAIIQAIDHAMGRMQKGAGAGIEVAASQNGDAANVGGTETASPQTFSTNKIADTVKDIGQIKDGANNTETGEESGEESGEVAGEVQGLIASDEKLKCARKAACNTVRGWKIGSSMLSDENCKSSSRLESFRKGGMQLGNSMSNAALVAQGKEPVKYEDPDELKEYTKELSTDGKTSTK